MIFSTSLCCSCLCNEGSLNIDYFQDDVNGICENTEYSNSTLSIGDVARHWLQRKEKECPSCGVIYCGTSCPNSKCPLKQKDAKEEKEADK